MTARNARLSHALSNLWSPNFILGKTAALKTTQDCKRARRASSMASLVDEQHEWNAVRVRQTFLDYFKKNGHTFGTAVVLLDDSA